MSFLSWFETQVQRFQGATFVDLIHVRNGNASARIERWPLPKKDPSSIASTVLVCAQQTAEALHSAQTFAVALVDEAEKSLVEHVMRVGDSMGTARAFDSEAPDMTGIVKMQMRHNEALMRGHVTASSHSLEVLFKENERLRARNDFLEERHEGLIALREELMSQQHNRDLSTYRVQKQEERTDDVVRTLRALVPSIAGKFLNQGAPADPGIEALQKSLSSEQMQAIARVLRPEQLAALSLIFSRGGSKNGQDGKAN